mmetsp:Transcript_29843/g.91856  ORF Transcript_29843/g.91856 Transcript_29843/m.91856 type:complete len:209 (+) Transcript_29843:1-627(+)
MLRSRGGRCGDGALARSGQAVGAGIWGSQDFGRSSRGPARRAWPTAPAAAKQLGGVHALGPTRTTSPRCSSGSMSSSSRSKANLPGLLRAAPAPGACRAPGTRPPSTCSAPGPTSSKPAACLMSNGPSSCASWVSSTESCRCRARRKAFHGTPRSLKVQASPRTLPLKTISCCSAGMPSCCSILLFACDTELEASSSSVTVLATSFRT